MKNPNTNTNTNTNTSPSPNKIFKILQVLICGQRFMRCVKTSVEKHGYDDWQECRESMDKLEDWDFENFKYKTKTLED